MQRHELRDSSRAREPDQGFALAIGAAKLAVDMFSGKKPPIDVAL